MACGRGWGARGGGVDKRGEGEAGERRGGGAVRQTEVRCPPWGWQSNQPTIRVNLKPADKQTKDKRPK